MVDIGGWLAVPGPVLCCREAGNKDENIAGFIAVLIIKSIKYGPRPWKRTKTRNEKNRAATHSVYLFYEESRIKMFMRNSTQYNLREERNDFLG